MPFASRAQQRYLYSQHPEIAKRWAKHTPDFSKLPERVKKAGGGLVALIRRLKLEAPKHARRLERAADEVPWLEQQFSDNALEMALRSPRSNVAIIDPREFESVAGPLSYTPVESNRKLGRILRDASESHEGRGFEDTPLLVMQRDPMNPLRWMNTAHEGRHRTRAMANEGMDRTLVNLIDEHGPYMWNVSPEGLRSNIGATTLRHGPRKALMGEAMIEPQYKAFGHQVWPKRPDIPWLKAFRSEPFKRGGPIKMGAGGIAFSEIKRAIQAAHAPYDKKQALQRLEKLRELVPQAGELYYPGAIAERLLTPHASLAAIRPQRFEEAAHPLFPRGVEVDNADFSNLPAATRELPMRSRRTIKTLADLLKSGGRFDEVPHMIVEPSLEGALAGVMEHQGRHRNRAISERGIDRALVDLHGLRRPYDLSRIADRVPVDVFEGIKRDNDVLTKSLRPGGEFVPEPSHLFGRGPKTKAYSDVFLSEPFKDGGKVEEDDNNVAALAGLAALAGATPIGRKLGMRGANALARPFQRARNAPIVHTESVAREPLSELQSDVRFGMGRSMSGHELAGTATTKGQGAWWSEDKGKMEFNPVYMQEMPKTLGRVSGEREQQKYAGLLGALLEQDMTAVTRAMKSPFNIPEGADAIFTRPVLREDIKRIAERLGPSTVVQHRPDAEALLFSLEGEPIEKLARRLRGVLPEPAIRYGVSRPGADRMVVTRPGMDYGKPNMMRDELGVPERAIPRERQEEAFRRALLNPRRGLKGMLELE